MENCRRCKKTTFVTGWTGAGTWRVKIMKRQRIKSKRRRLRIFRRKIWKKVKRALRKAIIKALEEAIKLRELLKSLRKNEDVILTAGMFGATAIFLTVISLYAFWDVLVAYFS